MTVPVYDQDGNPIIVEISPDSEVSVKTATIDVSGSERPSLIPDRTRELLALNPRSVFTLDFTDPGTPFGKTKPDIRVIMTSEMVLKMLSALNPGLLYMAISDPYPHV